MSAIGEAFNALRQVLVLQTRVDQLDRQISNLGADVDGLTRALADVRGRVSRIEGMIEGFGMAAAAQARLPRDREGQ